MIVLNYDSYIDDAQILLAYIAKEGKTVDAEAIKVILEFKDKLKEEINDNDIISFWGAYNSLVKLALPANIEMIKANVKYVMADGQESTPLSERIVKRYSRMTFVTLILILVMQIYWIIGKNIVNESRMLVEKTIVIETKEQEILEKQFALHIEMEGLRKQEKDIPNILFLEEHKLDRVSRSLRAQKFKVGMKIKEMDNSLAYTTGGNFFLALNEEEKEEDVFLKKNIEVQISKKFSIPLLELQIILNDTVYKYLLPMLFGLLGACVYILRQLSLQIENLTFIASNKVKFQLRLYLGTIAGLTFSWLFPVMDINSVFVASPLAVAFVVGYSIEVLFVALDKIINTLNGNEDIDTGELK
jgi:hypothetical protein